MSSDLELQNTIRRSRTQTLGDIPRRASSRTPDKTALVDGDTRLTFLELDNVIDRFAAGLQSTGLRKGDRLAVLAHNCWQYPVTILAAARLGIITVPINFMLNAREVAVILGDCDVTAFIAEDALVRVAEDALTASAHNEAIRIVIGTTDQQTWMNFGTLSAGSFPDAVLPTVEDDDVIRIMYTSGTESRPKGAQHTSRTLMWQYMSCISSGGMEERDIEVHAMPLYHCAQLDNFLMTDIYLGATSIILAKPDPEAIADIVEREKVTNLFCPPTVWISLLHSPEFAARDTSSLSKGYYGASALPVEILDEMRTRLPNLRLWNFYGQTEMGSLATVLGPEDQRRKPGSAGRAALNVETRIVSPSNAPLPAGEVGEIVHRSPQSTIGYLGQPEKTVEAYEGGWFHSGDLGYFDEDGYLWVVDRKKDMIKTGGENVSTREVEEALYTLADIAEVAVFGVPDPRWIEAVVAAVVAKPGRLLDEGAIITACRTLLASYKVPKHIVVMAELPKNPSGKILKRDLRALHSFH